MNIRNVCFLLCMGTIYLTSCKDIPSKNHGPIVLGDSSTIVTEKDPLKLQDLVTDLKPDIPSATMAEDTAKPLTQAGQTDTAKKATTASVQTAPPPAVLPSTPGLKAEFKEVSVLIPNVSAKQSGNPNLINANGAVYGLVAGNLSGNVLHTTGNVTKVSQRYISIVVLKTKNGTLPLENLTNTTSWEQVKGGNGSYPITGVDENSMEFESANQNAIKNAVMKSCQRRRLNHKKMQEWLSAVSNVKASNQKPLVVTLRSIMWKIDGKDPQGKLFSKQIRIDVPM